MSAYEPLAAWYDALTQDVDYSAFADFYERVFHTVSGEMHTLLDLCCGTGTLTCLMAGRGYEMIAADASPEMLMQAQSKAASLPEGSTPPLLLCQRADELDLYGTVDAAYCSLDGMNYLTPGELTETLRRLRLFIRPEGLYVFDVRTPESFAALDGSTFVDENEDVLCLWRADYDGEVGVIRYGMDLFERRGQLWEREREEHIEYAHSMDWLAHALADAGFDQVRVHSDTPQYDAGRRFLTARRAPDQEGR